jgi:hypothetical protein
MIRIGDGKDFLVLMRLLIRRRKNLKEKCYYHPDREAKQKCDSCGKPLCKEDIREKFRPIHCLQCCCIFFSGWGILFDLKNYYYCSECYDRKYTLKNEEYKPSSIKEVEIHPLKKKEKIKKKEKVFPIHQYQCNLCNKGYENSQPLVTHYLNAHPDSIEALKVKERGQITDKLFFEEL